MSDGGKGSIPRPLSVDREIFEKNWDKIFNNDYQDVLSTEDCFIDDILKSNNSNISNKA